MKNYAKHLFFALVAVMMLAPMASKAQTWSADPVHSTVMYTVKHMVTPMIGVFKKYNIELTWDAAKPLEGSISATLDASSVVMGMDKLEGHLQSGDFFDTANHPEWSFKSTSIAKGKKSKAGAGYIANGKLTVRGVTKDVAIPFTFLGVAESPYGKKAGFSAEFSINRLDYGVGQGDWAGTAVVANEVKINVMLEMNAKK
jgi:polyisoprenoid-binding protein YceI